MENKVTFGEKVKKVGKRTLPVVKAVAKFTADVGIVAVGTYVGSKLYSKTLKHPALVIDIDPSQYKITDIPQKTE